MSWPTLKEALTAMKHSLETDSYESLRTRPYAWAVHPKLNEDGPYSAQSISASGSDADANPSRLLTYSAVAGECSLKNDLITWTDTKGNTHEMTVRLYITMEGDLIVREDVSALPGENCANDTALRALNKTTSEVIQEAIAAALDKTASKTLHSRTCDLIPTVSDKTMQSSNLHRPTRPHFDLPAIPVGVRFEFRGENPTHGVVCDIEALKGKQLQPNDSIDGYSNSAMGRVKVRAEFDSSTKWN